MNTLAAVGIAAAAGVGLFLLERKTSTSAVNTANKGTSTQEQLANAGGAAAGWIGTKVANAIPVLKPIAGSVGKSAALDTKVNIRETINAGKGFVSIAHGNVWGGAKQVGGSVLKTAVSPIKSLGNVLHLW